MNPQSRDIWKNDILDTVLQALAANDDSRELFVFKGARILAMRLGGSHRRSLDLDAATRAPVTEARLTAVVKAAIHRAFSSANPVRFSIEGIDVRKKPEQEHPRGWDGFEILIRVKDGLNASVKGLPTVKIDIGAPEELRTTSTAPLLWAGHSATAYSLERIAGEKARAFLTSLPAYQKKLGGRPRAIRAKDIFDIHAISVQRPIASRVFWRAAGEEFENACRSRLVDCDDFGTFSEELQLTKHVYTSDPTLANTPFDVAWSTLASIVDLWSQQGFIPQIHSLDEVVAAEFADT